MTATDRTTDTPQMSDCLTMTASLRHGPVPVSDVVQRYICIKHQGSLYHLSPSPAFKYYLAIFVLFPVRSFFMTKKEANKSSEQCFRHCHPQATPNSLF